KKAEAPADTASKPEGASDKVSVVIISPALTSVFHQELVKGAEEAAKQRGWDFSHLEPDKETNSADQVAKVQDSIQRGVSAISICAVNDEALSQAVKKANDAGVPIFVHNSITMVPEGKVEAYIGYDQFEGGRKCGEKAIELLKAKYGGVARGKVAILEGTAGIHTRERAGGFRKALEGTEVQIVASQSANWLRKEGADRTTEFLQKYPDLDLVFGCSDAMAQGAAQAAKQAGKTVFTIGLDGNPDALADVKAGTLTATLVVFPREMGIRTIETIEKRLKGEAVGPIEKIETEVADKTNVDKFLK
ncbi:MAG: sugar ABC transporter substrate-binding protein, partial [Chthonomonadales bacterium]|nr:sugar ABC transporter substrate-binding protein [Chthonomonadales bacterium]